MNIRILILAAAAAVGAAFASCTQAVAETAPDKTATTPFSPVYSPEIPRYVELCGDKVDLEIGRAHV